MMWLTICYVVHASWINIMFMQNESACSSTSATKNSITQTSCQILLPTFWMQNPQTVLKATPNSQNGIYVPLNKIVTLYLDNNNLSQHKNQLVILLL